MTPRIGSPLLEKELDPAGLRAPELPEAQWSQWVRAAAGCLPFGVSRLAQRRRRALGPSTREQSSCSSGPRAVQEVPRGLVGRSVMSAAAIEATASVEATAV